MFVSLIKVMVLRAMLDELVSLYRLLRISNMNTGQALSCDLRFFQKVSVALHAHGSS